MKKLKNNDGVEYYVIDRLSDIQNQMFRLLSIVDKICRENGLQYFLDGGTAIGGLRHKGFVPWDDDLDISMLKPDYIKLVEILKNMDRSKYFVFDYDFSVLCCTYFGEYVPIFSSPDEKKRRIRPIKIDIRPVNVIEDTEENRKENVILRQLANYLVFNECDADKKEQVIEYFKSRFNSDRKQFFRFYNLEYGRFDDLDHAFLAHPYLKFSSSNVYDQSDVFPLKEVKFESLQTFVPVTDVFLTDVYGDYMSFPKLESRKPEALKVFDCKRYMPLYKYLINKNQKSFLQKVCFAVKANLFCK